MSLDIQSLKLEDFKLHLQWKLLLQSIDFRFSIEVLTNSSDFLL